MQDNKCLPSIYHSLIPPSQPDWEFYSFDELAEIAEDDDVRVTDIDSLKAYLDSRSWDLKYKYRGDDAPESFQFEVLFS